MKKHILSLLLIGTFASYAFFSQSNHEAYQSLTTALSTTTPDQIVPTTITTTQGIYKDGAYKGSSADAYYGYIQVQATVKNGQLADVTFLNYPQDRVTSEQINQGAMPILRSEAIKAQSANVNIVSGATDSSRAFKESLGVALQQALTTQS